MKKYQLGYTTDEFFTPLSKATSGENASIAYRDGRSNTFGKMGVDLFEDLNDSTAYIEEQDWTPKNRYWREGLEWTPDLTVGGAAKLAEVYDLDRQYEYIKNRSGTFDNVMRGTLNIGTMMILDEVNLIPFVGQFAKIGQGIKATTTVGKAVQALTVGTKSKTAGGAFVSGAIQTTPYTAIEAFYLTPQSEQIRRQQDISFMNQLFGFTLGTAAGGAFGAAGYGFRKWLQNTKNDPKINNPLDEQTPEALARKEIVDTEVSKLDIAESNLVDVEVQSRPDVDEFDLENISLDNKTKKTSFTEDGLLSKDATAPTVINSVRGVLSITTKKKLLQQVLESIRPENLKSDTIKIKVRGTNQRYIFTKQQVLEITPVLERFGLKKTKINKKRTMLEVKFEGDTYAITNNEKTGQPIAYKKGADGKYTTPEDEITSKKIFHGAVTKDPNIKSQIKQDIDGQNKIQSEATDAVEETVDVGGKHKNKTYDEVTDELTGEGYANITTPQQLDTLPETLGVKKEWVKAVNDGQTSIKRTVFVDGKKVEKITDLTELKTQIDEIAQNKQLLEEVESKLDDLMICNATN